MGVFVVGAAERSLGCKPVAVAKFTENEQDHYKHSTTTPLRRMSMHLMTEGRYCSNRLEQAGVMSRMKKIVKLFLTLPVPLRQHGSFVQKPVGRTHVDGVTI